MSPLSPRMLLLLVFTWGMGVLAAEAPAPAKPAPTPSAIDDVVAKLRKAGKNTTATRLVAAVEAAKAERQKEGRGHVLIGHLNLKGGTGRLTQLNSQVTLVEDGWFVTVAEDLRRPIPVRLHGYEAVDIALSNQPNKELLHLGEVSLSPVPADKLGTVKGRVSSMDPKARVQVTAFISQGDVNTLGSKVKADNPAARLEVKVEKDGSFQLAGLSPSPARYELWFKAPGLVTQSRIILADPGQTENLGEVRLEKPNRLRVRYMVSPTPPPFQNSQVQEAVVEGGQAFKATPTLQGPTFSYQQHPKGGRLRFPVQPARLTQLGKGRLEDYSSVDPTKVKFVSLFEVGFELGQLYLLDHRGANQWVLFVLEPDTGKP
ncbi:hypothetical protein [Hyalangium gracile]|uniref:hypothetical protein n=1 Tax=Hyalangium gracile TaxID=394092 RepID=UPI001CCFC330|nr:hypothetical protein [Hyalangium gracile]